MLSCRDMDPWLSTHSPTAPRGEGGAVRHQRGNAFPSPAGRLYGFSRQRRYKKWRRRRRTSPAGTVSQPIGKPFNGQAKGLLWLTWRSYAGPPQYFIPPEGGALNPSGRRQPVPDRTLGAQGQRPGGAINPHARKGVSTFGNTGKHRAERRLNPQSPSELVHKKSALRDEFSVS